LGLLTRLAAPGGLEDAVQSLVAELLALPLAVSRATKLLLAGAVGRDVETQLAAESQTQVALLRRLAAAPARPGEEPVPG
jgi:hypothetical protein